MTERFMSPSATTSGQPNSSVSRRTVLTAGLAAGAFAGSAASASAPAGLPPKRWDHVTDVVVVGSGAAGFAAAVTARSEGSSVTMLEKGQFHGGTTNRARSYWIPNNSLLRAKGGSDPKEWAVRLMARLAYPLLYNPDDRLLGLPPRKYALLDTYYDRGSEAIDYFASIGALRSIIRTDDTRDPGASTISNFPDYYTFLPENRAPYGRNLVPTSGLAGEVIAQMKQYADSHQVTLRLESRVVDVYQASEGSAVGVRVQGPDGQSQSIRARKGIVFGSGGFTHNEAMRRSFLRGSVLNGCAVSTNTGDFVEIAERLGAELSNMNNAWWMQQPLELALTDPGVHADVFLPPGDSMLFVNRNGHRVVNERAPYNERAQVHFYWDPHSLEYVNNILFMIYDEATAIYKHGHSAFEQFPIPLVGASPSYVLRGDSFEGLAGAIDARLAQLADKTGRVRLAANFASVLKASVNRFNDYAAVGKDGDFGRGDTPFEQYWSRVTPRGPEQKNNALYPLSDQGPYYCIPLVAATLDTKGGPAINEHAQILHLSGAPIEGLYGAGNCVASPAGQAYWSAGGTLGPALTFGYIAGRHAASRGGLA
jgi:3-oxosteroid 1-dehydrogenase